MGPGHIFTTILAFIPLWSRLFWNLPQKNQEKIK